MNLKDYNIDQLIVLKNEINELIYSYVDGHLYHCNVRSYGRNWIETPKNVYTLSELCNRYDGEDGIVDVYTTNPDLEIYNYGNVYYIKSKEDYDNWYRWNSIKNMIPEMEKELKEWENRDNVPFRKRPHFSPIYSQEDIDEYKKKLESYDMTFVAPILINEKLID